MDDPYEALRARYRDFASVECHGYSPLYERLARSVAADDNLLTFISEQPDSQPNLFFASVQYVSGADAMPRDGAQLAGFVDTRASEIAALMRTRRTQTNEIGRCAALLPALPNSVPLALIEVGASAGL